jgi:maltose-binding protein MalE
MEFKALISSIRDAARHIIELSPQIPSEAVVMLKNISNDNFLLNFIATDETMVALHEADPRGPTWIPVLDAIGDDPVFTAFATSGATGQFMPNVPEMGAVWDPLGNQLLAVRQGTTDATTAMTQAAEQVRNAIAGG